MTVEQAGQHIQFSDKISIASGLRPCNNKLNIPFIIIQILHRRNHFLFCFLFFACLLPEIAFSQKSPKPSGFGEGSIIIGQYFFAPKDRVPEQPIGPNKKTAPIEYRYFIKKDKILRDDFLNDSSNNSSVDIDSQTVAVNGYGTVPLIEQTLKATFIRPVYLIDWRNKVLYLYSIKKNVISKSSLKNATIDLFYRTFGNSEKTMVDTLPKDAPVIIANKMCFKGTAKRKDETYIFYYTKAYLPLKSPLNCFLPLSFPYNVLSISLPIDWTLENGKKGIGRVIFEAHSIKKEELKDSLFNIPPNTPIKENIPLLQLYNMN